MYGTTSLPAPPITGSVGLAAVGAGTAAPWIGWDAFIAVLALMAALGVWSAVKAVRLRGRFEARAIR
jgi:hypothetical protein